MPVRAIRPIREPSSYYDRIEAAIREAFWEELYLPILKTLNVSPKTVRNAARRLALMEAIEAGRVIYDDSGRFRGRFNSAVVIDLRDLGARFDRRTSSYFLPSQNLPVEIREAIRLSEGKFLKKLRAIDEKIRQKLPADIAGAVKTSKIFDSTLFHVDRELGKTLQDVTVIPQLTAAQRKQIADEWQNNLDKWIRDFADDEIVKLRKDIQASAFEGNRYESLIKSIQRSYGVTKSKATFLARQETSLLVAKFKEVRYRDAGVKRYRWKCVAGSAAHPVRPSHKVLDGTEHSWDNPPVTTAIGEPTRRNHPGEDFNCRCFAVPLVDF